jgi:hypothetical protein
MKFVRLLVLALAFVGSSYILPFPECGPEGCQEVQ